MFLNIKVCLKFLVPRSIVQNWTWHCICQPAGSTYISRHVDNYLCQARQQPVRQTTAICRTSNKTSRTSDRSPAWCRCGHNIVHPLVNVILDQCSWVGRGTTIYNPFVGMCLCRYVRAWVKSWFVLRTAMITYSLYVRGNVLLSIHLFICLLFISLFIYSSWRSWIVIWTYQLTESLHYTYTRITCLASLLFSCIHMQIVMYLANFVFSFCLYYILHESVTRNLQH